MSSIHRIQWFDQQIREERYPNSRQLAGEFEISRRQAQRDIEYMETTLRAPLYYDAKRRGYRYEDKTYALPLLYMTEEEKSVLKFLAYRYRHYNYENAEAVKRVAHLLERFTDERGPVMPGRGLPIFEANPKLIQTVETLSGAIRDHVIVRIGYADKEKEILTEHRIAPLKLESFYNADYVVAYCERENARKSFRLDRIRQLSVTDEKFGASKVEEMEKLESRLPVRKPFTAEVRLDQPLGETAWYGFAARPGSGPLLYTIEFYDPDAFMQHLLVAQWRELLSPKWLKAKFREKCRDMLERLELPPNK